MKITVETDDGEEIVFQNVIDAYLSVRQHVPFTDKDGKLFMVSETKSHSWGSLREIAKELYQSWVEIQGHLESARVQKQ